MVADSLPILSSEVGWTKHSAVSSCAFKIHNWIANFAGFEKKLLIFLDLSRVSLRRVCMCDGRLQVFNRTLNWTMDQQLVNAPYRRLQLNSSQGCASWESMSISVIDQRSIWRWRHGPRFQSPSKFVKFALAIEWVFLSTTYKLRIRLCSMFIIIEEADMHRNSRQSRPATLRSSRGRCRSSLGWRVTC